MTTFCSRAGTPGFDHPMVLRFLLIGVSVFRVLTLILEKLQVGLTDSAWSEWFVVVGLVIVSIIVDITRDVTRCFCCCVFPIPTSSSVTISATW